MVSESEAAASLVALCEVSHLIDGSLKQFDCGNKDLNKFTRSKLIKRDEQGKVKAIAAIVGSELAAYIALAPHQLASEKQLTADRYSTVPVLLMEQIATQTKFQGRGIAKRLIARALSSAISMSELGGLTGVALWAHPDAVSFYSQLGFVTLQTKPWEKTELTLLFIHIDTIKDALGVAALIGA